MLLLMSMFRRSACLLVLVAAPGPVLAQTNPCSSTQPVSTLGPAPVGQAAIVYDPNQSVCWLANGNLAASANLQTSVDVTGIDPNGAMDYTTALRWVAALNAANNGAGAYLAPNRPRSALRPGSRLVLLRCQTCGDLKRCG